MRKRRAARAAALLTAAAVSAGVLVAVASPAQAASLGTIALSQTSGSVTDIPMFASGTTSAACPQGYGANAQLRIGRPVGPFSNLSPSLSRTSGSGTVAEGEPGSLGEVRTLCSAAASSSQGGFDCGAGLTLSVPSTIAPGVYRATLTLTLA